MLTFALVAAVELAAGNAGLDPGLAFGELAVGGQAGQLGAGAGAAGRAVIGLAGAHDEVAAVGIRVGGKQLDMVDGGAVLAGDALGLQGLEHRPGERGESFAVVQLDALAVL
ncbi:hypothetical protein D3C78_1063670 [compost metagenome]